MCTNTQPNQFNNNQRTLIVTESVVRSFRAQFPLRLSIRMLKGVLICRPCHSIEVSDRMTIGVVGDLMLVVVILVIPERVIMDLVRAFPIAMTDTELSSVDTAQRESEITTTGAKLPC